MSEATRFRLARPASRLKSGVPVLRQVQLGQAATTRTKKLILFQVRAMRWIRVTRPQSAQYRESGTEQGHCNGHPHASGNRLSESSTDRREGSQSVGLRPGANRDTGRDDRNDDRDGSNQGFIVFQRDILMDC